MDDKILRRVRALLTQAEDPASTPAEAEAFSAKAEELITRYAIDQALLAEQAPTKGMPTVRIYEYPEPYGKAKSSLLQGIALPHDCSVIRSIKSSGTELLVYGFSSDLEAVDLLYTSLLLQGVNAVQHQQRGSRSFRTSFWYAYAGRVHTRLTETRQKAVAEHEAGTALVLADRKQNVRDYIAEQHGRLKAASRGRVTDRAGAAAGTAAADSANLGGTGISSSRQAIG